MNDVTDSLRNLNDALLMVGNDYSDVLLGAVAEFKGMQAEIVRLQSENGNLRFDLGCASITRDQYLTELESANQLAGKTKLAYGWLWHSFSNDPRVHAARRALADVLDRDMRLRGIEMAKAAGATVDEWGVLKVDVFGVEK